MPKPTSRGGSPIIEKVGISVSVGQIRRAARPAHSYGSPAMDLKKEQAEEERRRAEAEAAEAESIEEPAKRGGPRGA